MCIRDSFLDTAEIYPVPVSSEKQGATDRAIAKWMKTNGRARHEVIIATKVAGYNERFTWLRDGPTRVTREQIHASVDASLKRLGVDHLDLLQIHWPDRYVPMFGSVAYDCSKERDDGKERSRDSRHGRRKRRRGSHRHLGRRELLLGATYKIVIAAFNDVHTSNKFAVNGT